MVRRLIHSMSLASAGAQALVGVAAAWSLFILVDPLPKFEAGGSALTFAGRLLSLSKDFG